MWAYEEWSSVESSWETCGEEVIAKKRAAGEDAEVVEWYYHPYI